MSKSDWLICAYEFDREKGTRELNLADMASWKPGKGFLWIHLDRCAPETREWLASSSGLDAITSEALMAEETRPRSLVTDGSLLVILRGVNLNPGADPEDMVSVRVWADAGRIITLRGQKLLAIQDIRDRISAGRGPASTGELLALLAARLVERMGPVLDSIEDELAGVEEEFAERESKELRVTLSGLRRQAVALRRYLSPQRDVMARLSIEPLSWLTDAHRARLRETADRTTRYVEDLDAARERAAVTQEELMARAQDRMSRTMYILSLVAAVFLPLGFITGLLGINVGGIPGSESSIAFIVVCVLLGAIAAIEITLFHLRKWL